MRDLDIDMGLIMTCPACGHSPRPCVHPEHGGHPDRCCPCYHEEG